MNLSLENEEKLTEIQHESANWNILEIEETTRSRLFCRGKEHKSIRGVRSITQQRLTPNVQIFEAISERKICITFRHLLPFELLSCRSIVAGSS